MPPFMYSKYSVYVKVPPAPFERLLMFAVNCGCNTFCIFPANSMPMPVFLERVEELLGDLYAGVLPVEIRRNGGTRYSNRAHCWRFVREAIPRIMTLFPGGLVNPVGNRLCIYRVGCERVFLMSNVEDADATLVLVTQLQLEEMFRRGSQFEFESPGVKERRTFTLADMHINAPPHISILEEDYDLENDFRVQTAMDGLLIRPMPATRTSFDGGQKLQDKMLADWITNDEWGWRPDFRQLIKGVPTKEIEEFKNSDPKCKTWAWYNIIAGFAWARAAELGLILQRRGRWRQCRICAKDFHDSSIDVRRQAPDNAAVCQPCLKANLFVAPSDDLSREEIVEYVQNLSLLLKRVPPARYDFSRDLRRFTTDELLAALELNRHRPTPECVTRVCGSWLQA
jgi:hypothetical protein